jgi:hypothetical protein
MRRLAWLFPPILAALSLAGCGGGGEEESTTTAALPPIRGEQPPKDASPILRQVYRNFQPPLADPEVPGSGEAIRDGEAACEGKTPEELVSELRSRSDLSEDQRQALENLGRAEESPGPDFVAGQLAAMVYEGTLAEGELASYGYRGCVHALAEGLKGELGA